jgi:nucleoside-diphosphate-sugar epimerase
MEKTVLLTGAFGNIGKGTLNKLLAAGHKVICLDRETPQTREVANEYAGRISIAWGDIGDPAALARALEGVDTVVHLVGIIPPLSEQDAELAQRVNVGGTRAIIAAMEASPTARRLIFASSMAVFGTLQDRKPPLRNDSVVSPDDNYGRTKVAAEEAIRSSSLSWTILRICAAPPVEIPKGDTHDISTMFEMSADARIEFVHPEDVSTAFCNAVMCDQSVGKSLFLGGGNACRLSGLEFASNMVSGNGITGGLPAAAFKPSPIPVFYGDWVDTQESQRLLQFQHYTMDDFIGHMRKAMGWKYYLIRLVSPLAKRSILKHSPYL